LLIPQLGGTKWHRTNEVREELRAARETEGEATATDDDEVQALLPAWLSSVRGLQVASPALGVEPRPSSPTLSAKPQPADLTLGAKPLKLAGLWEQQSGLEAGTEAACDALEVDTAADEEGEITLLRTRSLPRPLRQAIELGGVSSADEYVQQFVKQLIDGTVRDAMVRQFVKQILDNAVAAQGGAAIPDDAPTAVELVLEGGDTLLAELSAPAGKAALTQGTANLLGVEAKRVRLELSAGSVVVKAAVAGGPPGSRSAKEAAVALLKMDPAAIVSKLSEALGDLVSSKLELKGAPCEIAPGSMAAATAAPKDAAEESTVPVSWAAEEGSETPPKNFFMEASCDLGTPFTDLQELLHGLPSRYTKPVPSRYSQFSVEYTNLLAEGTRYASAEDWREAVEAFRMAITLRPERPEAYLNLGGVLYMSGRGTESEQAFLKAKELAAMGPRDWALVTSAALDMLQSPEFRVAPPPSVLTARKSFLTAAEQKPDKTEQVDAQRIAYIKHYIKVGDYDRAIELAWDGAPRLP